VESAFTETASENVVNQLVRETARRFIAEAEVATLKRELSELKQTQNPSSDDALRALDVVRSTALAPSSNMAAMDVVCKMDSDDRVKALTKKVVELKKTIQELRLGKGLKMCDVWRGYAEEHPDSDFDKRNASSDKRTLMAFVDSMLHRSWELHNMATELVDEFPALNVSDMESDSDPESPSDRERMVVEL
jgi:hypothetical protein